MVFKTIADNIKSFFRKEDELEKQPNKAKDAAVEIFEKQKPDQDHRIVAHPLKGAPLPTTETRQKVLPFSSEQLKQRLSASSSTFSTAPPAQVQRQRASVSDEEIASQIMEFEQAINTMPGEDGSSLPISAPVRAAKPRPERRHEGYFDELARILQEKGYDIDDDKLEHILARMQQHHDHRLAHEKHQERGLDLEESLSRKLAELQELERDWASKRDEVAAGRDRIVELETTIAQRANELKSLVATLKSHAQQAPPVPASPSLSSSSPFSPSSSSYSFSASSIDSSADASLDENNAVPPPTAVSTAPIRPMSPPPLPDFVPDEIIPSQPILTSAMPAAMPAVASAEMRIVDAAHGFYLGDGRVLTSLADLRQALLTMDDAVFHHHVTPAKNDFAAWIRDVFQDEMLAERATRVGNKYDLARLLL